MELVLVLVPLLVALLVWALVRQEQEWPQVQGRAQQELVLVEEKVEVLEPGQSQRLQPE
jgi:hypothetical protein